MISRVLPSASLRSIAGAALDFVLPRRCLACGETIGGSGELCSRCWSGITFLAEPSCACCGLPFTFESIPGQLCGECLREPPDFRRARAVMRYDEASRDLILGFKHGDRTHAAPAFGRWMHRAGAALLADADLLIPVPLHWTRLFARRYNQAALLAHAVHAAGGPLVAADWLKRHRRTPSQGHLGGAARHANVRGAFALHAWCSVAGHRIILIDDVFTTGATVGECARVLRRAGALSVDVLTLARIGGEKGAGGTMPV
jgi:ComF family protein